jgi:hypothetical protein
MLGTATTIREGLIAEIRPYYYDTAALAAQ